MDWVHCNTCYQTPSQASGHKFFITSCGHISCSKCAKKNSQTTTPSRSELCRNCKQPCTYSEINRCLDRDSKLFFSSPKELATQYMTNLKKVLDFQSYHRSRFQKYNSEKVTHLKKFANAAKTEIKKRSDTEKQLQADKEKLTRYCKEKVQQVQMLEEQLAKKNEEIRLLQKHREEPSPYRSVSRERDRATTPKRRANQFNQFPQLNGDTPIHTLSMHCTTSTPLDAEPRFTTIDAESPIFSESPVVGFGPFMTTPALLGIPKQRRLPSTSKRGDGETNFFKM